MESMAYLTAGMMDRPGLPDCSVKPQILFFSLVNTGTRIIYDRKFLLDCRNSPLARTPPCCLPPLQLVYSPGLLVLVSSTIKPPFLTSTWVGNLQSYLSSPSPSW
uniref:Uncharacterized protein n=1 Tax=Monopterus albus TaxID=43700 RepID=A0A3Q3IEL8_MONAL